MDNGVSADDFERFFISQTSGKYGMVANLNPPQDSPRRDLIHQEVQNSPDPCRHQIPDSIFGESGTEPLKSPSLVQHGGLSGQVGRLGSGGESVFSKTDLKNDDLPESDKLPECIEDQLKVNGSLMVQGDHEVQRQTEDVCGEKTLRDETNNSASVLLPGENGIKDHSDVTRGRGLQEKSHKIDGISNEDNHPTSKILISDIPFCGEKKLRIILKKCIQRASQQPLSAVTHQTSSPAAMKRKNNGKPRIYQKVEAQGLQIAQLQARIEQLEREKRSKVGSGGDRRVEKTHCDDTGYQSDKGIFRKPKKRRATKNSDRKCSNTSDGDERMLQAVPNQRIALKRSRGSPAKSEKSAARELIRKELTTAMIEKFGRSSETELITELLEVDGMKARCQALLKMRFSPDERKNIRVSSRGRKERQPVIDREDIEFFEQILLRVAADAKYESNPKDANWKAEIKTHIGSLLTYERSRAKAKERKRARIEAE